MQHQLKSISKAGIPEAIAKAELYRYLNEPEEAESPDAYVMPSLAGLTLSAAVRAATAAGLHIVSAEEQNQPAPTSDTATAAAPTAPATSAPPAASPAPARTVPAGAGGTVVAQTPLAGHRVLKGDPVHITLSN